MAQEEVKITFTIDGIEKEVKSVEELQKEMNKLGKETKKVAQENTCLLYTSPSPRDRTRSRMPSSA